MCFTWRVADATIIICIGYLMQTSCCCPELSELHVPETLSNILKYYLWSIFFGGGVMQGFSFCCDLNQC